MGNTQATGMMIDPSRLERLYRFNGYGALPAPLWILGREEGLGKRPRRPGWSLEWELGIRAAWQPVMDLHQAHEQLGDPYWQSAQFSPAWTIAAMLARGLLLGAADWPNAATARQYVRDRLGCSGGETLLGEAFPLPKANVKSWPYGRLFATQREYKAAAWPLRREMWQQLLAEHRPRYLLAHGGWWSSHRETFGRLEWQLLNGGRVETASMAPETQIYLAPFFGRGLVQMDDLYAIIHHIAA